MQLFTPARHDIAPPPLAIEHLRAGRHREAASVCRERLDEAPDDAGALRLLAHSLRHLGHPTLAVLLLEQAAKAHGHEPALLVELGDALAAAGSTDAAAATYLRALAADPPNAAACFGMLELGRAAELEAELRAAAATAPSDPAVRFALTNVLLEAGRDSAAREAFAGATALDSRYHRRHARLGAQLAMQRQEERAGRMYRWGLALMPRDPELRHMHDALVGASAAHRAPDAYVVQVFDEFAETFDETLVGRLGYRGPELVVQALLDSLPGGQAGALSVLDAGCGTGLCGPLLRPLARRLVGIDLSSRMLELAEGSGWYDELRRDELSAAVTAECSVYDVIVAADVLIYFGGLELVFQGIARALRPGGLFACTIERHAGDRYALRSSGRYAHNPDYVRAAAAEAGLTVREFRDAELRVEAGRPVDGCVAVLERAPG